MKLLDLMTLIFLLRRSLASTLRAIHSQTMPRKVVTTPYTIDCPPTVPNVLKSLVHRHDLTLDRYLAAKPIAPHTATAFRELMTLLSTDTIILDSGCGTGRSSLHLGSLYPGHTIVDRSIARLSRNRFYELDQSFAQQASDNVWLVQAELIDFWRCCLNHNVHVKHHYLLYPNPYPKKARLKLRWYAHPSFPLFFRLASETIVVRSNWELYLQEFCQSVGYLYEANPTSVTPYLDSARCGPRQRDPTTALAWSNFERKYDLAGENTYEIELNRRLS